VGVSGYTGPSDYGGNVDTAVAPEQTMAKERKNMPVRLDDEAIRWAKIAASYKGQSLAEYASAALIEIAKRDVERSHAEMITPSKPKGKGAKPER
jgi:hypothetical protein